MSLCWVAATIALIAGALDLAVMGPYLLEYEPDPWGRHFWIYMIRLAGGATALVSGAIAWLSLRQAHRRLIIALVAAAVGSACCATARLVEYFWGGSWQWPPGLIHLTWIVVRIADQLAHWCVVGLVVRVLWTRGRELREWLNSASAR